MATSKRSRKSKGFPWGLALLGVGAYLFYRNSQSASSSTSTTVAPGSTTNTALPASTSSTDPDRALVIQVAANDPRESFKAFAATGDPADIATVANLIRTEWSVYGRCKTDACTQQWAAIVSKYNIHS